MLKRSFFFVSVVFLLSCSNTRDKHTKAANDSTGDAATVDSLPGVSAGTPDFLALVANARETFQGFLQGVAKTDSAGPYIYTEYYSDSLSFQLIYYPVKKAKAEVTFEEVLYDSTNYEGFEIFTFVYPMTAPEKIDDYHMSRKIYPAPVKAYVRRGKAWQLLGQSKAKDLTALNTFIIRTMYSIK